MNQRWNNRRDSYRPDGEPIRTADYEVAAIPDDRTAKGFVVGHHYSATYPAARFRYGLYRKDRLVGVAVFGHPCNNRVLTSVFPGEAIESVELSRFVLLDDVPANGETWFLGRCFRSLKGEDLNGVLSFSDPTARTTADGGTIFHGHIGTIYQAHNAVFMGRGKARSLRILPDGRVFSDRAAQKIRAGERGWKYASAILEAHGAAPVPEEGRREWLKEWTAKLTRPLRHPGNFKYAWALRPSVRKALPASLPYPKKRIAS